MPSPVKRRSTMFAAASLPLLALAACSSPVVSAADDSAAGSAGDGGGGGGERGDQGAGGAGAASSTPGHGGGGQSGAAGSSATGATGGKAGSSGTGGSAGKGLSAGSGGTSGKGGSGAGATAGAGSGGFFEGCTDADAPVGAQCHYDQDCPPAPVPHCGQRKCDRCHSWSCGVDAINVGNPCPSPSGNKCVQAQCTASGTCDGPTLDCSMLGSGGGPSNPCQVADCDPTDGLCHAKTVKDGTVCGSSSDPCNQNLTCQSGQCLPGDPVVDATPCDTPDSTSCFVNKSCLAGVCQGGTPKCPKDDCRTSACDATGSCVFTAVDPPPPVCDDHTKCTTHKRCVLTGTATVAECHGDPLPMDCSGAGQGMCSVGGCVPETGACGPLPANEGKPCADGSACTLNNACVAGVCTSGAPALTPLFSDNFVDGSKGWKLDPPWQIGQALGSVGTPSTDYAGNADANRDANPADTENGIAGVALGGPGTPPLVGSATPPPAVSSSYEWPGVSTEATLRRAGDFRPRMSQTMPRRASTQSE